MTAIRAHIAIDCRMQQDTGIGTVISNIVPRLIAQMPQMHFILLGDVKTLQAQGWEKDKAKDTRISFVACTAPIYSLREQWDVARALPRGVDLLWVPHYNVPLLYRGPLVVTVHDVCHLAWPDYQDSLPKRLYSKLMFRHIAARAQRIATDSDFTKQELQHYTNAPDIKIRTIHCGVDENWFGRINRKKLLPEENTDAKAQPKPYLLYVGNVKPHKNLLRLLKAYERIRYAIPQQLLIVGKKEGFIGGDEEVKRYAERLESRVSFTGYISDKELKQTVKGADALVMPSLYEGFGLPPLEAMACGTPVLCSNAASLPEVCGDAALMMDATDIADMSEKIRRIATDTKLQQRLREKGKKQARLFSWDTAATAYAAMIEETLAASTVR